MLTREQRESNRQYSPDVLAAREELAEKGWSYRTAAPFLGISYQHLCLVLTGKRISKGLLNRIFTLPYRQGK